MSDCLVHVSAKRAMRVFNPFYFIQNVICVQNIVNKIKVAPTSFPGPLSFSFHVVEGGKAERALK